MPMKKSWFKCAGFTSFQTCIDEKLESSDKKFKFGNQLTFDSMGTLDVIGQVPLCDEKGSKTERTLMIHLDVVDLEIPLLLALPSLSMLHCQLDFGKKRLIFPDGRFTELYITDRNHLTFTWNPSVIKSKEAVLICMQDV